MQGKIRNRIKKMLWEDDFDIVDFWGAIYLMGWGVWFLMPWEQFMASTVFGYMSHLANENVWGAVFLMAGLVRMLALLRDKSRERIVAISATTFLWLLLLTVFTQARSTSILVLTAGFTGIVSMWELVRIIKKMRTRTIIRSQINKT